MQGALDARPSQKTISSELSNLEHGFSMISQTRRSHLYTSDTEPSVYFNRYKTMAEPSMTSKYLADTWLREELPKWDLPNLASTDCSFCFIVQSRYSIIYGYIDIFISISTLSASWIFRGVHWHLPSNLHCWVQCCGTLAALEGRLLVSKSGIFVVFGQ